MTRKTLDSSYYFVNYQCIFIFLELSNYFNVDRPHNLFLHVKNCTWLYVSFAYPMSKEKRKIVTTVYNFSYDSVKFKIINNEIKGGLIYVFTGTLCHNWNFSCIRFIHFYAIGFETNTFKGLSFFSGNRVLPKKAKNPPKIQIPTPSGTDPVSTNPLACKRVGDAHGKTDARRRDAYK